MSKISKDEPFYQISQASKLIGITSDRLRTYEEEGLIKPFRTKAGATGKRLYSQNEIEWLEAVRELIRLGVSIPAIRVMLSAKLNDIRTVNDTDKQIVKLIKKLQTHPVFKQIS